MIRTAFRVATATALWIARPTVIRAMATKATSNGLSTLKGVVFDMDDTLVLSNLDISVMYKEVFGRDPPEGYDILADIRAMETDEERARAFEIIESIEEESRQNMVFMPGCTEVLTWLSHQKIPKALVTRNNQATTDIFCQQLRALETSTAPSVPAGLSSFARIVTRDEPIPPKPDPTAMHMLAKDSFLCEPSEIVMVGDSISNDVAFGTNAGTQTALLAATGEDDSTSTMTVTHLTELPKKLWKSFSIDGPLGNTAEANQLPLHGSPAPEPESELCIAAAEWDLPLVRDLLDKLSLEEILAPDETNGNTALIWCCETGNAEIASLLLKTVAEKTKSAEDRDQIRCSFANHRGFLGATALNRAARRGHKDCLEVLLSEDDDDECTIPGSVFDKDLPNDKLQHPLHFAAFKKNPEALEFLLQQGANPWVLDRKGRTPIEDTSCETCQSLLRAAMGSNTDFSSSQ